MKKAPLIAAACGTLLCSIAHAQYATPASTFKAAEWEIDAGVGYVFNSSESALDNGTNLHLGAYKLRPGTATGDMVTKFGGELYSSSIDGKGDAQLDTLFLSADIGVAYKVAKAVSVGITGGVGAGRLSIDAGGASDSSNCVGFQIRPEVIFQVSEQVGVSLSYRFLETLPLESNWDNMNQHAIELSVRFAF